MIACEKKHRYFIAAEQSDALGELALIGLTGVTAPVGIAAEKN
jgi:hypothetical protein